MSLARTHTLAASIALALLAGVAPIARAQTGVWRQISPPAGDVTAVAPGADGSVLFAAGFGGFRYDGLRTRRLPVFAPGADSLSGSAILEAANGDLWIASVLPGSDGNGLYRLQPDGTLTRFTSASGLGNSLSDQVQGHLRADGDHHVVRVGPDPLGRHHLADLLPQFRRALGRAVLQRDLAVARDQVGDLLGQRRQRQRGQVGHATGQRDHLGTAGHREQRPDLGRGHPGGAGGEALAGDHRDRGARRPDRLGHGTSFPRRHGPCLFTRGSIPMGVTGTEEWPALRRG